MKQPESKSQLDTHKSNKNTPQVTYNIGTEFHAQKVVFNELIRPSYLDSSSLFSQERDMLKFDADSLSHEAEQEYEEDLKRFTSLNMYIPSFFGGSQNDISSQEACEPTYHYVCPNGEVKPGSPMVKKGQNREMTCQVELRNSNLDSHFLLSEDINSPITKRRGLAFHEDEGEEKITKTEMKARKDLRKHLKMKIKENSVQKSELSESCDGAHLEDEAPQEEEVNTLSQKEIKDAYAFIDLINNASQERDPDCFVKHCIVRDVISNMQEHHDALKRFLQNTENLENHSDDSSEQERIHHKQIFSSNDSLSERYSTASKPYCL